MSEQSEQCHAAGAGRADPYAQYRGHTLTYDEADELLSEMYHVGTNQEMTNDIDNILRLSGWSFNDRGNHGHPPRLHYTITEDTHMIQPERTEEGNITAEALMRWFDQRVAARTEAQRMEATTHNVMMVGHPTFTFDLTSEDITLFYMFADEVHIYQRSSCPRYEAFLIASESFLRNGHEDEIEPLDNDHHFSMAEEIGVRHW